MPIALNSIARPTSLCLVTPNAVDTTMQVSSTEPIFATRLVGLTSSPTTYIKTMVVIPVASSFSNLRPQPKPTRPLTVWLLLKRMSPPLISVYVRPSVCMFKKVTTTNKRTVMQVCLLTFLPIRPAVTTFAAGKPKRTTRIKAIFGG